MIYSNLYKVMFEQCEKIVDNISRFYVTSGIQSHVLLFSVFFYSVIHKHLDIDQIK